MSARALLKQSQLLPTFSLTLLTIIWSIPTFGLLVTSLREKDQANQSGWWDVIFNPFNQVWSFEAFNTVLNRDQMFQSLISTIVVTLPATILPILIAANAAFAFTFINFRGREWLFSFIVALMVVPLQASLIPFLKLLVWFKFNTNIVLVGNYPSAWLVHSAFAMPLAIYIFRNYMLTLPSALIEAARVDGASFYQIFWRLIIPMSTPALASFAIFQFLWVWNDYLIAFIFVGDERMVMTYRLLRLLGQYGDGWQNVAAGSFLSMIIPLLVFFTLQRYFIRGLTAGSVK